MSDFYDIIGVDYHNLRKPDPRIATHINAALGDAQSIVNVGAGTGSYEPADREVTAVEPSAEMIGQRPLDAAQVVQASAEALPFDDNSFDAAMAVLTVHHWPDKAKGMSELQRVSRGPIVLLTFDPTHNGTWLTDYVPALIALDQQQMPAMEDYQQWLGPQTSISTVPVPHDCSDGFLYAYWRRPHAYLDPRIRKGMSSFWKIDGVEEAMARLSDDLENGEWEKRYGHLLTLDEIDAGYRLVVAR